MTDKKFQKLINDTWDACRLHCDLLKSLEAEYKNRYSQLPSDVDDDFFIDSFMYPQAPKPTVKQVEESAKLHKK